MRNLNRKPSSVSPDHAGAYRRGQLVTELDSYRRHSEQLAQKLEQTSREVAALQAEAQQASAAAKKEKKKSEGLLQRLLDAISSRNSMRGRLGNMTAQRNRALRQVETLAAQNQEVMAQLKATTDQLGYAYQQLTTLQTQYDEDMGELAQAYAQMPREAQQSLPAALKQLLDQIHTDYANQNDETQS